MTSKSGLASSSKFEEYITYYSAISLLHASEKWELYTAQYMDKNVYSRTVHNKPKLQTIHNSTNRMGNLWYIHVIKYYKATREWISPK